MVLQDTWKSDCCSDQHMYIPSGAVEISESHYTFYIHKIIALAIISKAENVMVTLEYSMVWLPKSGL